jgi:hypothetical protein
MKRGIRGQNRHHEGSEDQREVVSDGQKSALVEISGSIMTVELQCAQRVPSDLSQSDQQAA